MTLSLPTANPTITASGLGTTPQTKTVGVLANGYRVIITSDTSTSPYTTMMTIVTDSGTTVTQRTVSTDFIYNNASVADTTDTSQAVSVLPLANGDFVLAWSAGSTGSTTDLYFRVYNPSGTAITSTTQVDTVQVSGDLNRFQKMAQLADGNFAIVWAENGTAYGLRIFKPDGTAVTGQIAADSVTGDPGGSEYTHYIASSGTTSLVVYTAYGPNINSQDLHYYYTLFNESGTALANSAQLSSSTFSGVQACSVATLSNGNFVIEYKIGTAQMEFAIMSTDGTFVLKDQATANTAVATNAGVYALSGGGFVITSGGTGNAGQLRGDLYDNTGTLQQSNVTLTSNTNSGNSSFVVASGPLNGLVVAARENPAPVQLQVFGHTDPPCYAAGTHIATTRGEIAVEALRKGDRVLLADGGIAPVVWLGHRRVDCAGHRQPREVWPVRVKTHAFGAFRPARDLLLSPGHAVFVVPAGEPGVLIPIKFLVNGTSVVQEEVSEITYWHVELPNHAVLLAEGLPCESYLDIGNRGSFENGVVPILPAAFTPDAWTERVRQIDGFAPLVMAGPALASARRRLIEQLPLFTYAVTDDPHLRVSVDGALIQPERDGDMIRVTVAAGASELRLLSRTFVPVDVEPHSSDTRRLGVSLETLILDGARIALTDCRLGDGWHGVEPTRRWTDGTAKIDVRRASTVELRFGATRQWYHVARSQTVPEQIKRVG